MHKLLDPPTFICCPAFHDEEGVGLIAGADPILGLFTQRMGEIADPLASAVGRSE